MVVFLHAAVRSHSSRTYWLLYSFSFPFFLHLLKVQRPRRTSKIEYYPLFYLEKWDTKRRRLAVSFYSSFLAPSKQRALSPDKFHFLPLIQR